MTDESEPGGTAIIGCWTVVFGQDTPHDVLVDLHTKGLGDDQGDPRAPESGIALLELNDGLDEFLRGTFGAGRTPSTGARVTGWALLENAHAGGAYRRRLQHDAASF